MTADPPGRRRRAPSLAPPDLHTQLEAILHAVWTEEERWRREDRIDLAIRLIRER